MGLTEGTASRLPHEEERSVGTSESSWVRPLTPDPPHLRQSVQSEGQARRKLFRHPEIHYQSPQPFPKCTAGRRHLFDSTAQKEPYLFRSRFTAIKFFQHHISVPSPSTFQLDGSSARCDVIDNQRFFLQIDQTQLLRTVS